MENKTFHLNVSKNDLGGAQLAIIPGDPERVKKIATLLDEPIFLASNREFTLYRGLIEATPVIVCSTGIGGPSTSIAVEELAQLGVNTFLRVGTTGAIQPNIAVGDIIVTTGAVRLDGASLHFAPLFFPAVADFDVTTAMRSAAIKSGTVTHLGVTASSDTFYPGQERYDTFSGRVVSSLRGSLAEWQEMGVLNFEMESATLFTMCASSKLRAGCIAGVLVNRTQKEIPDPVQIKEIEQNMVSVVVESARELILMEQVR